jgi:hypothetical protein
MYLADALDDGPQLLAVHRLVRALREDALDLLAEDFELFPVPAEADRLDAVLSAQTRPVLGPVLGLRLPGGVGLLLRARDPAALRARLPSGHSPAWAALDSALLDHAVLPRVCVGAAADVVQYRSDTPAAVGEVEAGAAAALFLLRPVDAGAVFALASAGERMPLKSTWFRPKPRAGLIMRLARPVLAAQHHPGRLG